MNSKNEKIIHIKKDEDNKQGATERGLYNYLLNYERSNNGWFIYGSFGFV